MNLKNVYAFYYMNFDSNRISVYTYYSRLYYTIVCINNSQMFIYNTYLNIYIFYFHSSTTERLICVICKYYILKFGIEYSIKKILFYKHNIIK